FLAFGTTQKERVKRFEENLEAVRRLWTEDAVDMVGSHFTLLGASASPRPVQKPHPPIWIGANADPAIRRAARLGDCWYVNPHNRIDTIVRQGGRCRPSSRRGARCSSRNRAARPSDSARRTWPPSTRRITSGVRTRRCPRATTISVSTSTDRKSTRLN